MHDVKSVRFRSDLEEVSGSSPATDSLRLFQSLMEHHRATLLSDI